jgi:hypothetical protein
LQGIAYTGPGLEFGRRAKPPVSGNPAAIRNSFEDIDANFSEASDLSMGNFNIESIQ